MKLKRIVAAVALAGASTFAQADNFLFSCVTFNRAADCAAAPQFGLSVTGTDIYADFRFSNTGPLASSIADIYFDWTSPTISLSSWGATLSQSSGVSFSWGASPGNLPGGNSIGFYSDLGLDSNSPTQPNGVNPGEWLNIRFAGVSFANAVSGLNSGGLDVGIHVQGFSYGGSESFVTTPIPEAETYAMMIAGLGLMGWVARRRSAARQA